jgi:hypothetical protein
VGQVARRVGLASLIKAKQRYLKWRACALVMMEVYFLGFEKNIVYIF